MVDSEEETVMERDSPSQRRTVSGSVEVSDMIDDSVVRVGLYSGQLWLQVITPVSICLVLFFSDTTKIYLVF